MSALDKLLGKAPAQSDEPKGLFGGPLASMLASVIPKDQLEQLGQNVGAAFQFVKDSFDLLIRGNSLITEQNALIIKKLQTIEAHLGIANDDGSNSAGTGE